MSLLSQELLETSSKYTIARNFHLAPKIVIVDGQPGCGKTMLSPIIAALDRVELMTYAFEIEHVCRLFHFEKITFDAAVALVRIFSDHKLYQAMMGREMNFRFNDLSSAFRTPNPWKYFLRLFQKGDTVIPDRIETQKPIQHFTTNNLLGYGEPVLQGLGERLTLVEVVRHPLYMIKQQALNMKNLPSNPRDISIYFKHEDGQLPYYVAGWEELYEQSSFMERAIYNIYHLEQKAQVAYVHGIPNSQITLIVVPFEKFVIDPDPYMKQFESSLETKVTWLTKREMKRQKVPRQMIADGINLNVYKRYDWQPPQKKNEIEEYKIRREFAKQYANAKALDVLDQLCSEYEIQYFGEEFLSKYAY
ncbi:MAG: hypothetical protein HQM12_21890 [SAR324 cluster bacterium]|nr:hypothetical protein [SAR324 cluster bacterium]